MNMKTTEQRLSELEVRVSKLEELAKVQRSGGANPQPSRKKVSAKEFLLTKVLKSETERGLVLAYYLEHMEGMSSFNVNDVVAIFRVAKEKKPINPSDVIAKNASRGFVMEATEKKDKKKAWTLTATGERYVEDELNK